MLQIIKKVYSRLIWEIKLCFPFLQSKREKDWCRWLDVKGDETFRVEYDLNENSIVFDLGGYKGSWTAEIFSRYCCFVYIFEPVEEFASFIEKRFSRNKKIKLFKFGLADVTKDVEIAICADGSSIFKTNEHSAKIKLIKATDFFEEEGIHKIDLMKINIEGAGYDLLDHLIESGFIKNIKNIQVQFHDIVAEAVKRRASIQEQLKKTHVLTYCYDFIWENWTIKDDYKKIVCFS